MNSTGLDCIHSLVPSSLDEMSELGRREDQNYLQLFVQQNIFLRRLGILAYGAQAQRETVIPPPLKKQS